MLERRLQSLETERKGVTTENGHREQLNPIEYKEKLMIRRRYCLRVMAVALVLGGTAGKVAAQGPGVGVSLTVTPVTPKPADSTGGILAYSAKFLCGTVPHDPANPQSPPPGFDLVPGTYLTSINIHNRTFVALDLRKKAVQILPEDVFPRGQVGQFVGDHLGPDEGIQVDCVNIKHLIFPTAPPFMPTDPLMEGFVVVLMPQDQLDVVGVYTVKNVLPEPPPPPAAPNNGRSSASLSRNSSVRTRARR